MKVWILTQTDSAKQSRVEGVFSSEAKAVNRLDLLNPEFRDEWDIDCWIVDDLGDAQAGEGGLAPIILTRPLINDRFNF